MGQLVRIKYEDNETRLHEDEVEWRFALLPVVGSYVFFKRRRRLVRAVEFDVDRGFIQIDLTLKGW